MEQEEVVALMESSRSEDEWDTNCSKVKKACGGYPSFWYSAIVASGLADRIAKSYGSSADINIISSSRKAIKNLHNRPTLMPHLAAGEKVIGVYDQGLGKKDCYCNSLEDMQRLYDSYASGMALTLEWFIESGSEVTVAAP